MAKCLWCANMCFGDANWCSERERIYSDSYLYREHECGHFRDCGISEVNVYVVEVEYDTFNGTYLPKRHEEVVRCRDCKHYVIYETWNPKGETHHCNSFGQDVDADGFCAWGERRDA